MEKKTILIFGISSFLGSNLAEILKNEYRVIGTYCFNRVTIDGVLTIPCNITDRKKIESIVYLMKPDITLYCIGMSSIIDCHDNPKLADKLNTTGVFNVSNISERHGSKFILFSTNYVFQGEDYTYSENETPIPLTVYGNSMASSEFYVQKSCLNYLIFRCCPIVGLSQNPNQITFLERLNYYYFQEKEILCDDKVKTGFLDIWTLADIVKKCIEEEFVNRLFQVSSQDMMTHYNFADTYFDIIKRNKSLLNKGDWTFPIAKSLLTERVTGNQFEFSMDVSNIEDSLKMKLPTVKQSIQNIKRKLKGVDEIGKRSKGGDELKFI